MADKVTKLTDVIIPELFSQYVLEETKEKSELIASGAIENNPQLDVLVNGGGNTLKMPKWNDLTGESQVWSENEDIETDKITAHKEIATLILRAKGWSAHDLSAALAGDDPMRRIAERVAAWWIRDEKRIVMSILKGVFASSDMADHVLDISGSASPSISGKAILDAKQLMGDAASDLSLLYMHSAVYTELQKQQLIQYVQPADAKIKMPTYLGYTVITDDSAPVEIGAGGTKGVYTVTLGGTVTEDDVITVAGVSYTVKAADDTLAKIASGLAAALNASVAVTNVFTVTVASEVITFTQKVAGTGAQPTASVSTSATETATAATTTAGVAGVDKFTTYLLSRGCIQRGSGTPVGFVGTETFRNAKKSVDELYNRQAKVLHPKGMNWTSASVVDETPTNDELATGANWTRAATESKQVGMIALVHTL